MLSFALPLLAALQTAPAPEAPVSPSDAVEQRDTVGVVRETDLGDIVLSIESEAAPITAANFLRYVDEDRLDGTVFYRAMVLDWGEQPNGLVQGGVQYDPKRVLGPIAHEPTSETELTHRTGALSMARNEPGTATGDFSILMQDLKNMDADLDSEDVNERLGYAVFGYVVDGMDVVRAIHASPRDPDKGEGWMKGELLAKPVTIIEARRVDAPAD